MSDTKAVILARMLDDVDSTYDKTAGSFMYDAIAPVSSELEKAYSDQEDILDSGFVATASGAYLDLKAGEQGLTRKEAIAASTTVTITGSVGASIAVNDLVASDTVNFKVAASNTIAVGATTMTVTVECETAGSAGNVPVGAIKYFPITIAGLTAVTNDTAVSNGYAGETDAELRQRYYEKVQAPATSGNAAHYKGWAKEVTGVGDARIIPLWNGAGTVKVIIIDSNKTGAESPIVTATAAYIETVRPIGATVTVISATELPINVSATLTIDTGHYTLAQVKADIEAAITAYLAEIAFVDTYVSYAKIGSLILDTAGVTDYTNLLVNTGTANVTIADTAVAVLGVVTVV